MATRKKRREPFQREKVGSVVIPIYKGLVKSANGKTYDCFTVAA